MTTIFAPIREFFKKGDLLLLFLCLLASGYGLVLIYSATRTHVWADSKYNYTRTDHFLLIRGGSMTYQGVPVDGSKKMDDAYMESIEPFDYSGITEFNPAYLAGY